MSEKSCVCRKLDVMFPVFLTILYGVKEMDPRNLAGSFVFNPPMRLRSSLRSDSANQNSFCVFEVGNKYRAYVI